MRTAIFISWTSFAPPGIDQHGVTCCFTAWASVAPICRRSISDRCGWPSEASRLCGSTGSGFFACALGSVFSALACGGFSLARLRSRLWNWSGGGGGLRFGTGAGGAAATWGSGLGGSGLASGLGTGFGAGNGSGAGSGGAAAAGAGGGGGGGLVGGNGGVTGSGGGSNGGGGGAGSGNFNDRAMNTSYVLDTTGVPSITLTYELPITPGGNLPGGGGNGGGGGGGGGGTTGLPVLSAFRLSSTEFVPARRGGPTGGTQGTTVSYRATVAARTTFAIQARRSGVRSSSGQCVQRRRGRRGSSCIRYVTVGTFTRTGVAGFNTFNLTGRIGGRRLGSGRYRLQATARNDAGKSAPVRASFRIAS
jgi:hypothetical protein